MEEKVKQFKPVRFNLRIEESLAKKILEFFYEAIFAPINETLLQDTKVYFNSLNDLLNAIKNGQVFYSNNYFYGKFNSKISKELIALGANFNKRNEGYYLSNAKLPVQVASAVAQSNVNFASMQKSLLSKIDNINYEEKFVGLNLTPNFMESIASVDKQFDEQKISLAIGFDEKTKEQLAKDYTENLKPYIKEFTDDQILKLRTEIQSNVFVGYRAARLRRIIEERFNVSKNKAKFLARQETSILTSQYQQIRFQQAGVTKYKWSTSHDSRVRHDHKELNGKIFSWDSPPVVDTTTGKRANPGEDYNCRCVAIGVKDYLNV